MNGLTSWRLSQRGARWKCNTSEDAGYLRLDGKTPEALLFVDIGLSFLMRSVVASLWSGIFGCRGGDNETAIFENDNSNST